MIYQQQSHLPIIFQVDENIIGKVNHYLQRNKLAFTNVITISGKSYSRAIAKQVGAAGGWNIYELDGNTFEEVEKLRTHVLEYNYDLMVAVGGGKVIDTVKRVSYLTNINTLVIPTIISNDGLISPVSVIKNAQGRTESIPGMMPMGVVIDLNIIKESPIQYIRAAAGDILSNVSATNDWILALMSDRERMNDIAFHLARSAASSLIHFENIDLTNKQFLRLIIQGEISSGIAMSLAGTSRPCSGSEHLISHALDYLKLSNLLHGSQVASISLFTLFLQEKLMPEHIDFAEKIGIPPDFTATIPDFDDVLFGHILDKAREMRPGRYTVLSLYSNQYILQQLKAFKESIRAYNQAD